MLVAPPGSECFIAQLFPAGADEGVTTFGSRPAAGSTATKAGTRVAGTKAPVEETRSAVEKRTVEKRTVLECSAEQQSAR
jgi:hypothetical protein